jgi:flagellar hook-associated protein 1
MSGLFQSLSIANSGLNAARMGLDVAGQNIANVNTEGYSRRTLSLAEVPPVEKLSAGRGVEVLALQALRDRYVEARLSREQTDSSRDAALVDGLAEIEGALGPAGSSIDARLEAFFNGFQSLSVDVTSPTARDTVVREAQLLAASFNQLDGRLAQAARSADAAIRGTVAQVNTLSARIAALNNQIAGGGPQAEGLRDQRNQATVELSKLIDVSVIERSDGLTDVATSGGAALVVGAYSYNVDAVTTAPSGYASLRLQDIDVTQTLGGRLGGLIRLRDTVVPGYRASLDQLAYDIATQVNTLHASGFDGNGNAGGDLFNPLASATGAAASLTVRAAVAADSALVVGSATSSVGNNDVARAVAGLRNSRIVSGNTATPDEAWAQFVYQVGSDVAGARAATATRDQVVTQLQRLRDSVSGVSLDEEAANLMRFQRSYEANARFFTTIVDTLDTLMTMVR